MLSHEARVGEQPATVLDRLAGGSHDLIHRAARVDERSEFVEVGGQLVPTLGHASAKTLAVRADGLARCDRGQRRPQREQVHRNVRAQGV
jgi:hypothetical protein